MLRPTSSTHTIVISNSLLKQEVGYHTEPLNEKNQGVAKRSDVVAQCLDILAKITYMPSDKDSPKLTRPERRRLLRQARKNSGSEVVSEGKSGGDKKDQRKLVVALSFLLATCAAIALVHGGKLWFATPLWLKILGWAGIGGMGVVGFQMWKKSRTSFSLKIRWFWRIALILILGTSLGYFYSHLIREGGDAINLSKLKNTHKEVMEKTASWRGEHWSDQQCQSFLAQYGEIQKEVLDKIMPPTGVEFRLLMAIGQVGYQAGCDVDFDIQASKLLDKDDKWKDNAPWQYNTLRIWVNTDGWPRAGEGCSWEALRAKTAGRDNLYEDIGKLCATAARARFEPWVPGSYTQRAEQSLEIQEQGRLDFEEEIRRRQDQSDEEIE